jgi:hypothetical protein
MWFSNRRAILISLPLWLLNRQITLFWSARSCKHVLQINIRMPKTKFFQFQTRIEYSESEVWIPESKELCLMWFSDRGDILISLQLW